MIWLMRLAALSAAIAIAAGAFGAHRFSGKEAEWLRTGGFYQLVHAVAVLALVRSAAQGPLWTLLGGAALFAATLYAIALGAPRWFGAITPIGGALMIGGWLWLAWKLR
ncbi:DUF423 domain-containing protein [Sphingomonas tabacisoli]|uniref:DUF423 domain-containing protein n=1 Tax=Sphingomonas tabacisoli TaxID=2249466 RepID=A0ABW4I0S2_9SPHN